MFQKSHNSDVDMSSETHCSNPHGT